MKLIIIGFLSGIISGMGIGGGSILIPSLVLFIGLEQIKAQGINLLMFIPTAIVALVIHKRQGNIESKYTKKLIIPGILGSILGALLANSIDAENLRKYFGFFLLAIGLYEFFKKKEKE